MFQRTFNPGPSQVSDAVKADLAQAAEQNILSISHRSQDFLGITKQAADGLRQYFKVPQGYHVLLTASATDALELVIRNLVDKESFHFTNGNFSELGAKISRSFGRQAIVDAVEWGQQNDFAKAQIPDSAEAVLVTYNETSTGVSCTNQTIKQLSKQLSNQLLVVDITSAAGCVDLNIADADVWLFSVQKGIGLPSGLAVLFVSPRALERSGQLKHSGLFNFDAMAGKMADHQTIHTPNVLGIYLLAKQMERWNDPKAPSNDQETRAKAKLLQQFIETSDQLDYFVKEPSARSLTTVCIQASPEVITQMHQAAKAANLIIGSGYGKLKDHTCRIATFPSLTQTDIKQLIKVFEFALAS